MIKVKLSEIVEAIQFDCEGMVTVIELKTGLLHPIPDDDMLGLLDWEQKDIDLAENYSANPEDYLPLPPKFEVDEYQMMEDFSIDQENENLLATLKGKGAFRRFKNTLYNLELEQEWYEFRNARYEQFARTWCEDNDVEVLE